MILKMIVDIVFGLILMCFGFCGINYVIVLVCVFLLYVFMNVFDYICLGRNDIIVIGGLEVIVIKVGIGGFNVMKVLFICNDDCKIVLCFFDVDRDGFVLGEGGGVIILEELEYVKKRGVYIIVEIVGVGVIVDVYYLIVLYFEGLGVVNVMKMVLEDVGLVIMDVDYINVYGIFILLGDVVEVKVIQKVFGEYVFKLNISFIKLMIGYLLGVVGVIEVIVCILVIQYNKILLMINYFMDDLVFDFKLNLMFNEVQEREVNVVLSNIFGFGGYNLLVIFK